jgi:hypothetical protein
MSLDVWLLAREYLKSRPTNATAWKHCVPPSMPDAKQRDWDVEHFADEGTSGELIGPNLREVLGLLRSGQCVV